jgi:glutamyl-tRNA reductase
MDHDIPSAFSPFMVKSGDRVNLASLSFAHPAVPASLRADLALDDTALGKAHLRLRDSGLEAFILSTCLRVEMAWMGGMDHTDRLLETLYGPKVIPIGGEFRTDRGALAHLAAVAAGLESPLVGEPEVFGQFRRATEVRRFQGDRDGLAAVLNAVIAVARSTRKMISINPRGSLAVIAAEQAGTTHGRVAILGAGAMAAAAAEALEGVEVTVFARRPQAVRIKGVQIAPWEQAATALTDFAVVISATSAKGRLFGTEVLEQALSRRSEPLLLIDLAMPPGFVPAEGDRRLIYLDVDCLARSAADRPSTNHTAELRAHLDDAVDAAWSRLAANHDVGPVIAALLTRADILVEEEVRRFAGRLEGAADPRAVLSQLAHTVARRVLHQPISYLSSSPRPPEAARVVAEAFGLKDE